MSGIVVKPYWIHHGRGAIYSVDVHPDGGRLASCGDDRTIKIWNIKPIIDGDAEITDQPKKLCELTNHDRPVNCVRWSPCGKFLASASADHNLLIFKQSDVVANFGKKKNVEDWECIFQGTGHESDVEDLAWSPDSKFLASASLDVTIVIWSQQKPGSFEKHKVLRGHENWVKGIAWDPLNKYLASQGAEGCLKLWRTSDWKVETQITDQFFDHTNIAFQDDIENNIEVVFSRPSWSPDGAYLVASFGKVNNVYVSPVFKRGTWAKEALHVGHTKPTTISCFNPRLFQTDSTKDFIICAIGSMDQSVSFWTNHMERPKLVIDELFHKAILDIAWCPNGKSCFITSHDGTVAVITFDDEWFEGKALTNSELQDHIQTLHGDLLDTAEIWENPNIMLLSKKLDPPSSPGNLTNIIKPKKVIIKKKKISTRQEEYRDEKGRRIIIPMVVESPSEKSDESNLNDSDNNDNGKIHNLNAKSKAIADDLMSKRLGNQTIDKKFSKQIPNSEKVHIISDVVKKQNKINVVPLQEKSFQPDQIQNKRKASEALGFLIHKNVKKRKRFNIEHQVEKKKKPFKFEVKLLERKLGSKQQNLSKITCLFSDSLQWTNEINGEVSDFCVNHKLVICGTHEGGVHVFSAKSGRILMGRHLQVSSEAVIKVLIGKEDQVLAICNDGQVFLWKIDFLRPWSSKIIYQTSIKYLISRGNFSDAWFKDHVLHILLTSGAIYSYNNSLSSWTCVSDKSYWGSTLQPPYVEEPSITSLHQLSSSEKEMHTLSHLESELFHSMINPSKEFESFCRTYVENLLNNPKHENRLTEFHNEISQIDLQNHFEKVNVTWKNDMIKNLLSLISKNTSSSSSQSKKD